MLHNLVLGMRGDIIAIDSFLLVIFWKRVRLKSVRFFEGLWHRMYISTMRCSG